MKPKKNNLDWLMKKAEDCSTRYLEAEEFLMEVLKVPWWKKIFLTERILKFLKSRNKYKF